MPGTYSIFENGARSSIGNFSESQVMAAQTGDTEASHELYTALHGGSRRGKRWSGFKNFVKKFAGGISDVAKNPATAALLGTVAPEMLPMLGSVGSIAGNVRDIAGSGRVSGGRLSRGHRMRR